MALPKDSLLLSHYSVVVAIDMVFKVTFQSFDFQNIVYDMQTWHALLNEKKNNNMRLQ